jgi:Fur family transcriptional regulator, ferric uptake regulator
MPRPSPVTDAVRSLFEGQQRHAWSLDQLHDVVRDALGGADYSTIFRAVAALEREGVIRRLDLGDGKTYYEAGDDHHEHVRCESCGQVAEVPGCVLEDATAGVQSSTGFKVTSHRLVFTGLCPECAGAGARRSA